MFDSFATLQTIVCKTPVYGISQARTLEWLAVSSSRGPSQPRDQTRVSCTASQFFTTEPPGKSTVLITVALQWSQGASFLPSYYFFSRLLWLFMIFRVSNFKICHSRSANNAIDNLMHPIWVLHSICQQIWKTQKGPQDWKRSVFIPIPKKGSAKECPKSWTIDSLPMLVRLHSKSFKLGFSSTWNKNFQMNKQGLEKAEIKFPTFVES